MIKDPSALKEIRDSWSGVEALRQKLQRGLFASMGSLGGIYPFFVADAAHNLPFIHAYSVLNDALEQLAKEGKFSCKSIFLGTLLAASKPAIPWADYALIESGTGLRNGVAHDGTLIPRAECWKYIDAIKVELTQWGILDAS